MHWQLVADALRQELVEYGSLLNLFEQQQESLFNRDADAVLRLGAQIEEQVHQLHDCREQRETGVRQLASSLGLSGTTTLRALLSRVEPDARPLLEALVNEVNHLLHRVRRTSRHNHMLLARTVEMHQETLRQLRPDAFTKTYSPQGRISLGSMHATPALRAAG
jgi:flagellar biosynthesis/type III secretory pathway chaperone